LKAETSQPQQVSVHLLPSLTTPEELADAVVVVIDVLRATTTIVHALAAGAREIAPCQEVEEARQLALEFASEAVVLGGERGGLPLEGFDFGNSPREYTAEHVGGKTVVFTTTNGVRAMRSCAQASRILIGSFVNYSAVCGRLTDAKNIHLLCAGTNGRITREDVLLAGAFVDDIARRTAPEQLRMNDEAELAVDAWRSAVVSLAAGPVAEALRDSRGGRNLIEIGQEKDIEIAAQIDKYDIVPELHLPEWRVR